jgi:hypothetical protein
VVEGVSRLREADQGALGEVVEVQEAVVSVDEGVVPNVY